MKCNIVLIGFMGSGKSTVGKALSQKLGYDFVDTDDYIETTQGQSISNIFKMHGESAFRKIESESIKDLSSQHNRVIATGGGVVKNEENMAILKEKGWVVFLKASPKQLEKNLRGSTQRPLLDGHKDKKKRIEALLEERKNYYKTHNDLIVEVDGKTVDEIAEEIVKGVKLQ